MRTPGRRANLAKQFTHSLRTWLNTKKPLLMFSRGFFMSNDYYGLRSVLYALNFYLQYEFVHFDFDR